MLYQHLFLRDPKYNLIALFYAFSIVLLFVGKPNSPIWDPQHLRNLSEGFPILTEKSKKEFNFDAYYREFKKRFSNQPLPEKRYWEWFLGFFEGDGSFIVAKRGDLSLVLTQSVVDKAILEDIKHTLCIGRVEAQPKQNKTWRWTVSNKKDIFLMVQLFNGNLVFPMRALKFKIFLDTLNYNRILNKESVINAVDELVLPTLSDAWISGITDAEGCFTASILTNSQHAFRVRYILAQKHLANKSVLNHIIWLWNNETSKTIGSVVPHYINNVWEVRVNGLKNCQYIIPYFLEFQLKTTKRKSFDLFLETLERIQRKDHMNPEKRSFLKGLTKLINKKNKEEDTV